MTQYFRVQIAGVFLDLRLRLNLRLGSYCDFLNGGLLRNGFWLRGRLLNNGRNGLWSCDNFRLCNNFRLDRFSLRRFFDFGSLYIGALLSNLDIDGSLASTSASLKRAYRLTLERDFTWRLVRAAVTALKVREQGALIIVRHNLIGLLMGQSRVLHLRQQFCRIGTYGLCQLLYGYFSHFVSL